MTHPKAQLQARRALSDRERTARDQEAEGWLLRACLHPGAPAIEAWHAWRATAKPVDDLPSEQHRLIPLLHANLSALGVTHPDLARYAAVRRFYWIHQQALWREMRPVVDALIAEGVRVMLLKSYPLLRAYPSSELRPSHDLDIWIHPDDLLRAYARIETFGYPPALRRLRNPRELARGVAAQHSVTFRRRGGRTEIDVHGRLHKALPSLTLAERLYRAAPTLPFGEHPVAVLPSDAALVHAAIYAQGTRGRVVSRGVVDVAMLLQSQKWTPKFGQSR